MNAEHEALDALVRGEGWKAFSEYVAKEWGTAEQGGGTFFLSAVSKAANMNADADATAQLRQILAAQKAIHRIMAWPEERIKTHQSQQPREVVHMLSRRGNL